MYLLGGGMFGLKTKVDVGMIFWAWVIDLILLSRIFSNSSASTSNSELIGQYGKVSFFGSLGLWIRIIVEIFKISGK